MSEEWPPEWEDPEEEFPGEADQLDATVLASGGEARLSEVAAFLASVPAPALPDAFEARISAALAAEAATRAEQAAGPAATAPAPAPAAGSAASASAAVSPAPVSPAPVSPAPVSAATASAADPAPTGPASASGASAASAAAADGSRKLENSRVRPRVRRRSGGGRPRRRFRIPPKMAAGSLIACLLLVGLGYGISRSGPQSSYSSSAGAPAAGSGAESASSAAGSSAAGAAPVPSAGAAVPRPATTAGPEAAFAVIMSGTEYTQTALPEQVRTLLGATGGQATFGQSASGGGPSQALQGCVLHLTGGVVPRLVDQATYQGEPVYVIASSTHVWVVGPGCTAAKTELIESVPLAGLPGNLRALISVEQQAFTGRRVQ